MPGGWSGPVVADGVLYIGSMNGGMWALGSADGIKLWETPLTASAPPALACAPSAPTVAIYSTPAVEGDLVYIGAYNGKVYAFNSAAGALRWVYPREGYLQPIVGSPIIAAGTLYIGCSDGKLYALDAATGDWKWAFQADGKIWSTPALDSSRAYIGSLGGKLYTVDVTEGKEVWAFEAQGAIISTPLISAGFIYIGSFDHYLYALDSLDGRMIWKFPGSDWFWARPSIYQDTIYAGCLDGKVYAIYATGEKRGEEKWHYSTGGPISSSPVMVDDLLVVASEDGQVYVLRADNGGLERMITIGSPIKTPLYAEGDKVYVHAQDHSLRAIEAHTGKTLWQTSLKE